MHVSCYDSLRGSSGRGFASTTQGAVFHPDPLTLGGFSNLGGGGGAPFTPEHNIVLSAEFWEGI